MRRFWSFYQNESYQVGCSGRTVYIYDKAGNELAKFRDIPFAYTLENLIYDETTAKALLQLQFEKFCQTLQQKGIQIVENDVKIKKYQKGMKAEGSIRIRIMDGEERKIE